MSQPAEPARPARPAQPAQRAPSARPATPATPAQPTQPETPDTLLTPDMLEVTFVIGTTAGGTGAHVRSLAAGLTARGARVSVLGPAATERLLGFTAAGARFAAVEIADRPRPLRDLAAVARLRRQLRGRARGTCGHTRRGRALVRDAGALTRGGRALTRGAGAPGRGAPTWAASVAHAHGLRAGALTALALAGHGARPVLVVTLHNAPPAAGGTTGMIYRVLERIVARRADRVLCVSADLAERMRRRGARSVGRAVVAAPAAARVAPETARAARAALAGPGRPLVLAAGRLAAQKGFGTLLDATAGLRGRDPQPLVVIAGDGPLGAELARRIDTQRLPLRLLGHRGDIAALLAAADLFVLPSVWEGQPLILQEALRAAVPIVATRVGGIPDLTGEEAAILVPPGDAGQLAAAMLRVLDEPGLAARLAAAAARRARSLPGEATAVDAVLADYLTAADVRCCRACDGP